MIRILVLLSAVFLVSCGKVSGTKVDAKNFENLLGSKFFSCSEMNLEGDKEPSALMSDNGQAVYLRFKNGGFSGRAPVNLFFGAMKLNDTEAKFGDIGATMRAGEQSFMTLEQKFFTALNSVNVMKFDEKSSSLHFLKDKHLVMSCLQTTEEEMREKISEALEKKASEVLGTNNASDTSPATISTMPAGTTTASGVVTAN